MTAEGRQAETVSHLSPMQYDVTQESATEPPFDNEFWDHSWPSFTVPLVSGNVIESVDRTHGTVRTEVRSARGDSHLGHVFTDGLTEEGGLRYCINSAALRFVRTETLKPRDMGTTGSSSTEL